MCEFLFEKPEEVALVITSDVGAATTLPRTPAAGSHVTIDVVLEPRLALEVTVLESDGDPVHPDTFIYASPLMKSATSRWWWHNLERVGAGRYSISKTWYPAASARSAGIHVQVFAPTKEGSSFLRGGFVVREPSATLTVPGIAVVRGRVVDEEGNGVSDVEVVTNEGDFAVDREHAIRTDADGRFALHTARDRAVPLLFRTNETPRHALLVQRDDVDQELAPIVLEKVRPIEATVVHADGSAPERVAYELSLDGWKVDLHTVRDGTGRLRTIPLGPGAYTLQVWGPNDTHAIVEDVRPGTPPVRLVLRPHDPRRVQVEIVGADDQPLTLDPVRILAFRPGTPRIVGYADEHGTLYPPKSRPVDILVEADGYLPAWVRNVAADATRIRVRLTKVGRTE